MNEAMNIALLDSYNFMHPYLCSNILLADDDDDDCLLFRDVVAELYPEVTVARAVNGKHLLELLDDNRVKLPDIIFLDVNMPLMSGLEALAEIRQADRLRSVPVIMFSTSAHSSAVNKAFNMGARYFVQKPDSPAKLKIILKKLLTTHWTSALQVDRSEFVLFD